MNASGVRVTRYLNTDCNRAFSNRLFLRFINGNDRELSYGNYKTIRHGYYSSESVESRKWMLRASVQRNP